MEHLADRLISTPVEHRLEGRAPVSHHGLQCTVDRAPLDQQDDDRLATRAADGPEPVAGDGERERAVTVGHVPNWLRVGQPDAIGTRVAVDVLHRRRDDPRCFRVSGGRHRTDHERRDEAEGRDGDQELRQASQARHASSFLIATASV